MPTADSASMPPLNFRPASEAPVDPNRLCLVAPADEDWLLAHLTEDGWFSADGGRIDEPLLYAALPPAPGRASPRMVSNLAKFVSALLQDGEYGRAASLIDELADRVRAVRDSPVAE
jgi:hypothetical protein